MSDETFDEEIDWASMPPSKSQLKREALAFIDLAEKLLRLPVDQVEQLPQKDIVEAISACRKITKGNARKRQLQYVGKLLRNADTTDIQALVDRFDASSREHNLKFHQLEDWRERLIAGDNDAPGEIMAAFPDIDRQHLRALTRNAQKEREAEKTPPVNFRKLFQYLKSQVDA